MDVIAVAVRDQNGEVAFGILKVLELENDFVSYRELINATINLAQLWESFTENQEVREYLENVKRVAKIILKLFPDSVNNSVLLELLKCIADFNFQKFENGLFLAGARFRKIKVEELLQENLRKDRENWLWLDFVFVLEKEEKISKEEFLNFLKKFEDESFLNILRNDYKEFLKKLFERA